MSNVESNRNLQPTIGALNGALKFSFFGALDIATYNVPESEQLVWPDRKPETEKVAPWTLSPSYSLRSNEITAKQPEYAAFSRDMAAVYTSLSDRQERLGEELEAAIFDDLDNLYID